MNTLVFDIETNAIDFGQWNEGDRSSLKTIHCMVVQDLRTSKVHKFVGHDQIRKGLILLDKCDQIAGHNVTGFDLPCLERIFGWVPKALVFDTKNEAKNRFTDVSGHRLKDWGERLGILKGDFGQSTDWSKFTQSMLDYCEQDVAVTSALYNHIKEKSND